VKHQVEYRDVVAVERVRDGAVQRTRLISRSQVSARVRWAAGGEVEQVFFDDPALRFLTAAEARRAS